MKTFIFQILKNATLLFVFCSLLVGEFPPKALAQYPITKESILPSQETEFLTFEELISLSKNKNPEGPLKRKLERFWTTPIINNMSFYRGGEPIRPSHSKLGPYLGVLSWNIEKSYHLKKALKLFSPQVDTGSLYSLKKLGIEKQLAKTIHRQRRRLLNSDILVLQEMDIGVKRSGYVDAAAELAKALDMNYAYAPEQLEIDPAILGQEKILLEDGGDDIDAMHYFSVDPKKYKGVFGSAVLSHYPIKYAEVFQLENQPYDWYGNEKKKTSFLEKARRVGVQVVFKNELRREMKVGGRIYFRVDLDIPDLPGGTLSIINIHLEIKCLPEGREKQMKEILSYTKDIPHPVVVLGDFNAAPGDLSPTNIPREVTRGVKNPTNWFQAAINHFSPEAFVINSTRTVSNITKNLDNPLALDVPIIAPNKVKPLFDLIQGFRFKDGGFFDARGDKNRSIEGRSGEFSNSNQRDLKGFKTTFQVRRPIFFIGKYRLDWVFVKRFTQDANSYRLAPHFGETLMELNNTLKMPISDHHPNVVDLPFEEPRNL